MLLKLLLLALGTLAGVQALVYWMPEYWLTWGVLALFFMGIVIYRIVTRAIDPRPSTGRDA